MTSESTKQNTVTRANFASGTHGEMFERIRPATAMVEVSALIDPAMLVEIEADAFIVDLA